MRTAHPTDRARTAPSPSGRGKQARHAGEPSTRRAGARGAPCGSGTDSPLSLREREAGTARWRAFHPPRRCARRTLRIGHGQPPLPPGEGSGNGTLASLPPAAPVRAAHPTDRARTAPSPSGRGRGRGQRERHAGEPSTRRAGARGAPYGSSTDSPLSLREREAGTVRWRAFHPPRRCARRTLRIGHGQPPLPPGEGWGEGSGNAVDLWESAEPPQGKRSAGGSLGLYAGSLRELIRDSRSIQKAQDLPALFRFRRAPVDQVAFLLWSTGGAVSPDERRRSESTQAPS